MNSKILKMSVYWFLAVLIQPVSVNGAEKAQAFSVPKTFTANTPAVAAEMNANFDTLEQTVQDLLTRMTALEIENSAMAIQLAGIENNTVLDLDNKLILTSMLNPADGAVYDVAQFTGVNVQLVNGMGNSAFVNGTGNLILGYNGASQVNEEAFCSYGRYDNQIDCEGFGYDWASYQRNGSHNLVIGDNHGYSSSGGIISGSSNIVNAKNAAILGGYYSRASGQNAAIAAGYNNTIHASASYAAQVGGQDNVAYGSHATIVGGKSNIASGHHSVVSGGYANESNQNYSVASGGSNNIASGNNSVVMGGYLNLASGLRSSAIGGQFNVAAGDDSMVSGGSSNTANGERASISGGHSNQADAFASSISGGRNQTVSGDYDWRAGSYFYDEDSVK